MTNANTLNIFVRDSLGAGRSRAEISEALAEAGWSQTEVSKALSAYLEKDFDPPVPRPQMQLTARDAFSYALLFAALGVTAWCTVYLIHNLIDSFITDQLDSQYHGKHLERSIRLNVSMIIVSLPIFIWISRLTNKKILDDLGHKRSLVRKWLTYLALFISALFFLGSAVFTIYNFLSGELGIRFALKVFVVALVSGGIFIYYYSNVEERNEKD